MEVMWTILVERFIVESLLWRKFPKANTRVIACLSLSQRLDIEVGPTRYARITLLIYMSFSHTLHKDVSETRFMVV
jgi:hypothetical protein